MQFPLRARLLVGVTLINGLVFGVGLYFLSQRVDAERERVAGEFAELLPGLLRPTLSAGGKLRVAEILRWPLWQNFGDAAIVAGSWDVGPRGEIRPRGAQLNPLGRARRRADFDEQAVLAGIARAVGTNRIQPVENGFALPVADEQGFVWGGCWFALPLDDGREPLMQLLPWFLLSTALLTLGTFTMLRRFVLDPVEALARGSRRVAEGDLATRVVVPARRDELSELMRAFNAMAETVEGFNARLAREVEVATENARRAEKAAIIQQRLAATGELAAGIAHEINNPLGGLLNAVEALETRELSSEKRAQYLGLLKHGLERIQRTVGGLLRFTPRASRHSGAIALVDPIVDALGLVQWRARASNVRLELNGVDTSSSERDALVARLRRLPPIQGDAGELAQAVLNLLVNALDALEEQARHPATANESSGARARNTAEPPAIRVAIELQDGALALSIEDDGPGVPAEILPHVADLFFTTKDVGKGTGLGLSIVHNAAAAHGARVHMGNAPRGGFRVEIVFPLPGEDVPSPAR